MAPNTNTDMDSIKEVATAAIVEKAPVALTQPSTQLDSEEEEHARLQKIMTAHPMPMITLPKHVQKPLASHTAEADARSIYIGNVDYSVSTTELADHFKNCGSVIRVTIPTNYGGKPKGYGYLEFTDIEAVKKAETMTGTLLKGRQIKVDPKRANQRGFTGPNKSYNTRPMVKYVYAKAPVDRSKYSKRYVPY